MKKFFLLAIISFFAATAFAQNKKVKNAAPPKQELETVVFHQAMKYGDVGVAINSLYALIAKHPEEVSYKDSLALIYFKVASYNQCLRVCDDLLVLRPNDTTILRMMAKCHQSLGYSVEAIADFEKVVKLTGNVYDIYQKAALEYRMKRLQESKISVEAVIKSVTENDIIVLYIDQENKQEVPLRAAALNLYGMIAKDFNDTASARFLFNEAIKLYPEFYFANANLKLLNETAVKKPEDPSPADKKK